MEHRRSDKECIVAMDSGLGAGAPPRNDQGTYGVACTSLAWITGPVGWPVGEPPGGSSEMP